MVRPISFSGFVSQGVFCEVRDGKGRSDVYFWY